MNKITKAVIPCGGMGTRFLPITKAVPKEILPIVDTPVLDYIVQEAVDSGITDILIIINKNKKQLGIILLRLQSLKINSPLTEKAITSRF